MFRSLSLRKKLMGVLALTTCIGLLAAGIVSVAYDFVTFKSQRINELKTQAEMLGAISTAALAFEDREAGQEYLATLAYRPSVRAAVLFDAHGRVFATYLRPGSAAQSQPQLGPPGQRIQGGDLLLFQPIRKGTETVGTVYLRADLGLIPRLAGYTAIVLTVALLALGVALFLTARLQTLIAEPLTEVAEAAQGVIARRDYSPRIQKRSEDEVGQLVDAFNQMLAEIEQREASLRETNATLRARTVELARSNEDLERFAHVASHDLQEPLRMVSSFTQLLARRYKGRLDEEADEFIQYAVDGAQTMQTLIRDLLAYSKAGTGPAGRQPTPIGDVVERAQALLLLSIRDSGATFEITDLPTLEVDAGQFTQLFQNLLGNALKFRSSRPLKIEVGARQEDRGWTLWVKDNGIGIDPRFQGRIFTLFQRLHTRDEYPGTGIGLSICKRIVERHGGTITVESQLDAGTCFTMHFPDGAPMAPHSGEEATHA